MIASYRNLRSSRIVFSAKEFQKYAPFRHSLLPVEGETCTNAPEIVGGRHKSQFDPMRRHWERASRIDQLAGIPQNRDPSHLPDPQIVGHVADATQPSISIPFEIGRPWEGLPPEHGLKGIDMRGVRTGFWVQGAESGDRVCAATREGEEDNGHQPPRPSAGCQSPAWRRLEDTWLSPCLATGRGRGGKPPPRSSRRGSRRLD